ncbi:MAG: polysaccharide biosynthesis/export family protein [Deltaproteobacteria bacterium]|nr:polysaccharide biosynthesis/export family protein [Deltaproteobacteria bacterium]
MKDQKTSGVWVNALAFFLAAVFFVRPAGAEDAKKKPETRNEIRRSDNTNIPGKTETIKAQKAETVSKENDKARTSKEQPQTVQDEYVIGTEDVLEISVWRNAELSKVVAVRPDGMITLPLIGEIRAAGLTPGALRDIIVERLKEYQDTVVASVIVQEVRSYRIFVLGEVINPGTYTMMRKTSVIQAIALAGGFNQFASRKLILIREGKDLGAPEKINIRFDDLIDSNSKSNKNIILRPGDTIFVP